MTDNEMLGYAAKAAGYDFRPDGYDEHITGPHIIQDGFPVPWNPITDDGDAMRLAIKLGFRVYVYPGGGDDKTVVVSNELSHKAHAVEPHGCDPYASTRLAIVRAAAEIGKGMP